MKCDLSQSPLVAIAIVLGQLEQLGMGDKRNKAKWLVRLDAIVALSSECSVLCAWARSSLSHVFRNRYVGIMYLLAHL